MPFIVTPASSLTGSITTPGDKSISHRALLIAALAPGTSTIEGLSSGRDVLSTAQALRDLGISVIAAGTVVVDGGADRMVQPLGPLDCGNSGTTFRLLLGLLGGLGISATLTGDASLSSRPMDRVKLPLAQMGISVEGSGQRCLAPVIVSRDAALRAIDYTLPVASAQVKSAVLFAGLFGDGPTVVREHTPTRIHTEEMLAHAGIQVTTTTEATINTTVLPGIPKARSWTIPGDPSQAAFFVVAGLLAAKGTVIIPNLYSGPGRSGFVDVLIRMGADISVARQDASMTLTVRPSDLHATEIAANEIPSLDEVPILIVAATGASGTTVLRDLGELRVKESDRFSASASLARSLGAQVEVIGDDLTITGVGSASRFASIVVDPQGDHRMAMSAAIAGTVGNGATISDEDCVETSFPGFFSQLSSLA